LSENDEPQVMARVANAYGSRARIREQLEVTMPGVKRKILSLFSQFGELEKTQSVGETDPDLVSSQLIH
jgi:hypothetical protein